jgi:hypothetical protein
MIEDGIKTGEHVSYEGYKLQILYVRRDKINPSVSQELVYLDTVLREYRRNFIGERDKKGRPVSDTTSLLEIKHKARGQAYIRYKNDLLHGFTWLKCRLIVMVSANFVRACRY